MRPTGQELHFCLESQFVPRKMGTSNVAQCLRSLRDHASYMSHSQYFGGSKRLKTVSVNFSLATKESMSYMSRSVPHHEEHPLSRLLPPNPRVLQKAFGFTCLPRNFQVFTKPTLAPLEAKQNTVPLLA